MQTVESKIREYLLDACGVDTDYGIDDDIEMAGLDSLDDVEFVMWAEEEFNIEINDEDGEAWETLRDIISYVEARI